MSTLKVDGIRSNSASSDAITLASDGTCTAQLTNRQGRNLVFNGAFTLAQYGTTSTTEGYGTVDRFRTDWDGLNEAVTQSHHDLTSSETPYSHGFTKKWKITNGNQTSVDAGDWLRVIQSLESQHIRSSGWKYTDPNSYLTISFWVRSSVAQTYYFHVKTYDGTPQTYAHPYALSANTWTKVTHSIPGNANLTFDDNNNLGLEVQWVLYYGTDYTDSSASDNTWVAHSASVQTKVQTSTWYDTDNATFELAGVQLEVGSEATDFDFESKLETLTKCQRYYYEHVYQPTTTLTIPIFNATQWSNSYSYGVLSLPTTMRIGPSLIHTTGTDYYTVYANQTFDHVNSLVLNLASPSVVELKVACSLTQSHSTWIRTNAQGVLVAFTAEFT